MANEKKLIEKKKEVKDSSKESADNADFFVNIDDIPNQSDAEHSVVSTKPLPSDIEDNKYRPKSDEELQKIMSETYVFDHSKKSAIPFILSAVLLGLFYSMKKQYLEIALNNYFTDKGSSLLAILLAGLAGYLDIIKILYPLWVVLIFKFFPFRRESLYSLKFNYMYLETFKKATYTPNIERVRIPWSRIVKVEFVQGRFYPHLDLYDDRKEQIACIRWDFKNLDKIAKGIRFFNDKNHPLHKFVDSINS